MPVSRPLSTRAPQRRTGAGPPRDVRPPPLGHYVLTWIALLALLAITAGSSFFSLGHLNLAINLAVAVAKALLVVFVFMHVRRGTPIIRVFAVAGLMWLALLVALSITDFVSRYG